MSSQDPTFDVSVLANGRPATQSSIDAWELKAAKRDLHNLKTLLYGQPMLDLLASQIEASDAYYKEIIAASHGRFRECRTDLHVTGVSATQVVQFRTKTMGAEKRDMALRTLLPAHPEHYALPPYEEGIVEVIGGRMARLRIVVTGDVPEWVMGYGDPGYPMKKPTLAELDDGTVFFYILHEFRDREGGCDLITRLLLPEKAP